MLILFIPNRIPFVWQRFVSFCFASKKIARLCLSSTSKRQTQNEKGEFILSNHVCTHSHTQTSKAYSFHGKRMVSLFVILYADSVRFSWAFDAEILYWCVCDFRRRWIKQTITINTSSFSTSTADSSRNRKMGVWASGNNNNKESVEHTIIMDVPHDSQECGYKWHKKVKWALVLMVKKSKTR